MSPEWPEPASIARLQKPFRPNELIRAIEAAWLSAAENLGLAWIVLAAGFCRYHEMKRLAPAGTLSTGRVLLQIRLPDRKLRRQGHREAAEQALGTPVEFSLSSKLQLDAGDDTCRSKSS